MAESFKIFIVFFRVKIHSTSSQSGYGYGDTEIVSCHGSYITANEAMNVRKMVDLRPGVYWINDFALQN